MRDSNFPSKVFFLLSLSLISLFTSGKAIAFGGPPGGPFGNGSYFPTDGTFQATIRAVNLSGVATFNSSGPQPQSSSPVGGNSTSNSTSSSMPAGGYFTAFYQGTVYSGNVDGGIDPSGGTISATLEGSNPGNGNQTISNTINSTFTKIGTRNVDEGTSVVTTNQTTVFVVPGGSGPVELDDLETETSVTTGNITTVTTEKISGRYGNATASSTLESANQTVSYIVDNPDSVADDFGWVDMIATSTFLDSLYAAGFFNARLKNSFPNQIFKGSGSLTFTSVDASLDSNQKIPVLVNETVGIKVRGVRISDTSSSYQSLPSTKPSVVTSVLVENRPTGNNNNSN
jgi:hypothetical protein